LYVPFLSGTGSTGAEYRGQQIAQKQTLGLPENSI